MATSSPPAPTWILRHHAPSPVHALAFYQPKRGRTTSRWLIAGDAQGRVSLTSLKDYRQRLFWKAHGEALLGVGCWRGRIVTHARDNTFKIWALPQRKDSASSTFPQKQLSTPSSSAPPNPRSVLPSAIQAELPEPELLQTLEVNALNFCKFALLDTTERGKGKGKAREVEDEALVAVPHTLEAAWIDIYHLPSGKRLYAAIGKPELQGAAGKRAGIAMSLHLLRLGDSEGETAEQAERGQGQLGLVAGYEDGRVALWRLDGASAETRYEGGTWTSVWDKREHTEAVLATAFAKSSSSSGPGIALSVSADANLVKWDLTSSPSPARRHRGRHVGSASCALRASDAKLAAVGGWDGRIRLFDISPPPTSTSCDETPFNPLGVLSYHKETVQALAFSPSEGASSRALDDGGETSSSDDGGETSSSDDEDDAAGEAAETWLAAAGKDGRISLWRIPF